MAQRYRNKDFVNLSYAVIPDSYRVRMTFVMVFFMLQNQLKAISCSALKPGFQLN